MHHQYHPQPLMLRQQDAFQNKCEAVKRENLARIRLCIINILGTSKSILQLKLRMTMAISLEAKNKLLGLTSHVCAWPYHTLDLPRKLKKTASGTARRPVEKPVEAQAEEPAAKKPRKVKGKRS